MFEQNNSTVVLYFRIYTTIIFVIVIWVILQKALQFFEINSMLTLQFTSVMLMETIQPNNW